MKLATLATGSPDGVLVVVSSDGRHFAPASYGIDTLQTALEDWATAEPILRDISNLLESGELQGLPVSTVMLAAPLPRAWQWLDGSVFPSHGELMDKALGIQPEKVDRPMMYQGVSDTFYGPNEDVPMSSEELGIDFEGEFGVIVDEVPMGVSVEDAAKHIKLVVQINDWSLRALAGLEMKTGFGWIQAKPPCSMAPFAVTPEGMGQHWRGRQVHLNLSVAWNDKQFGNAYGGEMAYAFDELVAHAARTRKLVAGTVIGSGTVSNSNFREVGSSCIAERRGIEIVDEGEPKTNFMKYGDRIKMEANTPDGGTVFGAIDQQVIEAK